MSVPLAVEGLEVWAQEAIVQPLSFQLCAGRPFTVLGETGSGKSLLAQAIMGNLPAGLRAGGRVTVHGETFDASATAARRKLWGQAITLLPQEPWLALDPTMRAQAQVSETYRFVRGFRAAAAHHKAQEDLEQLGLGSAAQKLPSELSGGMAQRVAFAAARAGGARLVLADEPTKGLDAARRDDVVALLKSELSSGGALFTITHDVDVARQLGGEVAVMRNGVIVERGTAENVLREPQHPYTQQLLAAEPAAWHTRTSSSSGGEPVIAATGLSKTRGGSTLFSGLDLSLAPGEILGVSGPSGCGKSTLGDILLKLLPPDSGSVYHAPKVARHRYGKLYQDPPAAFPPHVTLGTALDDLVRRHKLERAAIEPAMTRLKLHRGLLERKPQEVSGGELQRLALLRVLLLKPVFLFADEPTSRLDLITQQETIALLTELAEVHGCAVLLVSHDLELIRKVADRHITL